MEVSGKRALREQILHRIDRRTACVSDEDIYREIDRVILHPALSPVRCLLQ